jgi:hypothetical protein
MRRSRHSCSSCRHGFCCAGQPEQHSISQVLVVTADYQRFQLLGAAALARGRGRTSPAGTAA